jgi:hypothetical protein
MKFFIESASIWLLESNQPVWPNDWWLSNDVFSLPDPEPETYSLPTDTETDPDLHHLNCQNAKEDAFSKHQHVQLPSLNGLTSEHVQFTVTRTYICFNQTTTCSVIDVSLGDIVAFECLRPQNFVFDGLTCGELNRQNNIFVFRRLFEFDLAQDAKSAKLQISCKFPIITDESRVVLNETKVSLQPCLLLLDLQMATRFAKIFQSLGSEGFHFQLSLFSFYAVFTPLYFLNSRTFSAAQYSSTPG